MNEQAKNRYLEYLPAIYQQDPLLRQFLIPFEQVVTGFENLLSEIDRYFAPAHAPTDFLPWLAGWVALMLDEEWREDKRRILIANAMELYKLRGTTTGLREYLKIYTGLEPNIRECRWPGGMQIGVASRIGGLSGPGVALTEISSISRPEHFDYYDYYVIETDESGEALCVYYRADKVKEIKIEEKQVTIQRFGEEKETSHKLAEVEAPVTRRYDLPEKVYTLQIKDEKGKGTNLEYKGDTLLIDEDELPYRFIVDVRVPIKELKNVKMDTVRKIIEQEKPAHTMYYIMLGPPLEVVEAMQIGFRSTIGYDTRIG